MPELPQDLFYEACHTAVAKNLQFVPPHAPHGGVLVRAEQLDLAVRLPERLEPFEATRAIVERDGPDFRYSSRSA
jgi:hypothetical protein